jgi:zinc protease
MQPFHTTPFLLAPLLPFVAGALVTAATPAGAAPQEPERGLDVHIPYTHFTLENGMNVLVHEDRSLPTVSVNLWYHVGSANERPGRTGFAHLFEHVMFEGSANVPRGDFDSRLEAAGGYSNGSTTPDRTNYWENVPSNALELALWLEADRMGWLLETMDQRKLDIQREVVKNERRQRYENAPYGLASEAILAALYPPEHPYHWPVIGSMDDLAAADLDDVMAFFRTYYAPNNATLSVAGAVSSGQVRRLVERWFGEIPAGPPVPPVGAPDPELASTPRLVLEDDVRLPRLYLTWHSPPAYGQDDAVMDIVASALAGGKSSRLHRRLVHEEEIAQDVTAWQQGQKLGGSFRIVATARPGVGLATLEAAIREEIDTLVRDGIRREEMERAVHDFETRLVRALESVGGFGGKADRLNEYHFFTGNPGFVRNDLARYHRADAVGVADLARRVLQERHSVVLSVVPRGGAELAAAAGDR